MERPYIDFAYYAGEYFGTKIPEQEFMSFARRASLKMDEFTFGRLERWPKEDLPDSVFDACCAVAEVLYDYDAQQKAVMEATGGGAMKSENNDGYSITFGTVDRVADATAANDLIARSVNSYLGHSGLLFRGTSRRWDSR